MVQDLAFTLSHSHLRTNRHTHTHSHTTVSSNNSPRGNGQSSALLPTEHFVPPEHKHTDLSQQLSSNTATSLPPTLPSSPLQPLFLCSSAPCCPPLPSHTGNLWCLCQLSWMPGAGTSPSLCSLSLCLSLLSSPIFMQKEFCLLDTPHACPPGKRWRHIEESFRIKMANQTLQNQPLYQHTRLMLPFPFSPPPHPLQCLVKWTPPSGSASFSLSGRKFDGPHWFQRGSQTDSWHFLFFKNLSWSFIFLALLRLWDYCPT